jgi:hypothetical protein
VEDAAEKDHRFGSPDPAGRPGSAGMIQNQHQPAVTAKLKAEVEANPLAGAVAAAAEGSAHPFEIETSSTGLEVVARAPLPNGVPNRARMKIFSPKPGHTLVFFFKKSLVPYSRDRYSYGGLDLRASSVEAPEIAPWLDFLTSGFHPDKRPGELRRAFPYEIPE